MEIYILIFLAFSVKIAMTANARGDQAELFLKCSPDYQCPENSTFFIYPKFNKKCRNELVFISPPEEKFCELVSISGQVSAWQSATLLPIRCKSVQPVPARVDEPASLLSQSSSAGATNNSPFPKMPQASMRKVGCQNWHANASAYSAAGGEHDQQSISWPKLAVFVGKSTAFALVPLGDFL